MDPHSDIREQCCFDLARWAIPDSQLPKHEEALAPAPASKMGRRVTGKFLRGPIPWDWLEEAMKLPGKALHLGLMLWQQAGFAKGRNVHFCQKQAAKCGIPINTARRAIQSLERAGLISVRRLAGRGLDVTILSDNTTW